MNICRFFALFKYSFCNTNTQIKQIKLQSNTNIVSFKLF